METSRAVEAGRTCLSGQYATYTHPNHPFLFFHYACEAFWVLWRHRSNAHSPTALFEVFLCVDPHRRL